MQKPAYKPTSYHIFPLNFRYFFAISSILDRVYIDFISSLYRTNAEAIPKKQAGYFLRQYDVKNGCLLVINKLASGTCEEALKIAGRGFF